MRMVIFSRLLRFPVGSEAFMCPFVELSDEFTRPNLRSRGKVYT